jgi:formylglycine-generating enzyme required for sulfatase activity
MLTLDEAAFRERLNEAYGERPRDRPAFWEDPRFHNPSQPVVGVTWYEARAYCCWLTARWRVAGEGCQEPLPENYQVRLPSEAEWERAARYRGGGRYPWGRRSDPKRANTEEGHVRRTSPVGAYPGGATGAGVQDLAGNVWEWTLSLYQPYPVRPGDGRDDPRSPGHRVVRGGSWFSSRGLARCAVRNWDPPEVWNDHQGFRVVLSLANSEF